MFGLAGGDPRLSFKRTIAYGDLVIVYEKHEIMRPIIVTPNAELHNRFGVFMHNDWVGKPFGSRVLSVKGVQGYVYILAATPEIWTLCLQHRTQILYLADISLVIMYLEIVPGCLVLESGTGTGSLTTSIARSVAPNGHVHTFDFHEQRAQSARSECYFFLAHSCRFYMIDVAEQLVGKINYMFSSTLPMFCYSSRIFQDSSFFPLK